MGYRPAWALQAQLHHQVVAGGEEQLLLVEHPPVVTLGRRPGAQRHLLASPERLAAHGVELVESDRGGDITFHGPGQLVVYPIVRLADHRLSVGSYVHGLEAVVVKALGHWGIQAHTDPAAVGVWVQPVADKPPAKVCAIGVRIRRGVSMHGLALNVSTDLRHFDLIVPCGLAARPVTSLQQLLPDRTPDLAEVKRVLAQHLRQWLLKP